MNITKDVIYEIEHIGAQAWPAKIELPFYEWKLRANEGVTKRANSVFTIGGLPKPFNWLEKIEKFYNEQSIVPCFYISKLSPHTLDPILAKHDYVIEGAMYILYHHSKALAKSIKLNDKWQAKAESKVTPEWLDTFLSLEAHNPEYKSSFNSIFEQINMNKTFLTLYSGNTIVAVGTIASMSSWGYISNVVVNQSFRRKGIGSQVIGHLANWAVNNNVERVFLQVLKENKAGLKLYETLNFTKLTESHFRIKK